jgi:hypothetical protein
VHLPSPLLEQRLRRGAALVAVTLAVPALAACGAGSGSGSGAPSGSSPESANARLANAGTTVQTAMTQYLSTGQQCKAAQSPVVCLEKADRTLGGEIHDYANVLAVGHGFSAPASELSAARNAAQTLANSLEILGDAEPTQANYDQVLNSFNVNGAISSLQAVVTKVQSDLR